MVPMTPSPYTLRQRSFPIVHPDLSTTSCSEFFRSGEFCATFEFHVVVPTFHAIVSDVIGLDQKVPAVESLVGAVPISSTSRKARLTVPISDEVVVAVSIVSVHEVIVAP